MEPAEITWIIVRLISAYLLGYFIGSFGWKAQYRDGYNAGVADGMRAAKQGKG